MSPPPPPAPQASCFERLLTAAVCTYNPLLVLTAYISLCGWVHCFYPHSQWWAGVWTRLWLHKHNHKSIFAHVPLIIFEIILLSVYPGAGELDYRLGFCLIWPLPLLPDYSLKSCPSPPSPDPPIPPAADLWSFLALSSFLTFINVLSVKWGCMVVWICLSLINYEFEHLFIYFLAF